MATFTQWLRNNWPAIRRRLLFVDHWTIHRFCIPVVDKYGVACHFFLILYACLYFILTLLWMRSSAIPLWRFQPTAWHFALLWINLLLLFVQLRRTKLHMAKHHWDRLNWAASRKKMSEKRMIRYGLAPAPVLESIHNPEVMFRRGPR